MRNDSDFRHPQLKNNKSLNENFYQPRFSFCYSIAWRSEIHFPTNPGPFQLPNRKTKETVSELIQSFVKLMAEV